MCPPSMVYKRGSLGGRERYCRGIRRRYIQAGSKPDEEQLIVFIYNYAGYKGCDMALGRDFNLQLFKTRQK